MQQGSERFTALVKSPSWAGRSAVQIQLKEEIFLSFTTKFCSRASIARWGLLKLDYLIGGLMPVVNLLTAEGSLVDIRAYIAVRLVLSNNQMA